MNFVEEDHREVVLLAWRELSGLSIVWSSVTSPWLCALSTPVCPVDL